MYPVWLWYVPIPMGHSSELRLNGTTALCPNGVLCCPTGDNCVPGGCCRPGSVQCSSISCYNPATQVCCSDGFSCQIGYDCVSGGCCPKGQKPCGARNCYDPTLKKCCNNGGACDKDLTCCGKECCSRYATCRADGYCEGNKCTVTSTYSTTRYATQIKTVTKITEPEEEEEAPEFTCPPLTVTNQEGDTLELGDDCGLTLNPATEDLTATASETNSPTLKARAPQADDNCLYTTTDVVTYSKITVTTKTTTVTREEPTAAFSCPPLSVTNAAGDELSLDEECKLGFSPGTNSAPPTSATAGSQQPIVTGDGAQLSIPRLLSLGAIVGVVIINVH